MLHQTKGIVFHSLKYSESSLIVKIYTELFGLQTYLIRGVRNPKSKITPAFFSTLTLLDLVASHKENNAIQSVKEIRLAYPFQTIPFDIRKSSVALFLNELVYKSIREEESNPGLFEFLWESCMLLDATEEPVANFHLLFALQLTIHLGINPQVNYSSVSSLFNLRDGVFQQNTPNHPHHLDREFSELFYTLLSTSMANHGTLSLNSSIRNRMLEMILLYYQLHLPGFKGLKSHHVLHSVFS